MLAKLFPHKFSLNYWQDSWYPAQPAIQSQLPQAHVIPGGLHRHLFDGGQGGRRYCQVVMGTGLRQVRRGKVDGHQPVGPGQPGPGHGRPDWASFGELSERTWYRMYWVAVAQAW